MTPIIRITTMEGERNSIDPTVPNPRSRLLSRRFLRMVSAMPNKPRPDNRAHTIRVPDPLWEKAIVRAEERGESISEAVRKFLERYTR